uniref:Uncharacterized protein n=1 Tax=Cacopsylla melanoneura TaxID=428564 RepID=A0A8D8Z8A2_9HEMI
MERDQNTIKSDQYDLKDIDDNVIPDTLISMGDDSQDLTVSDECDHFQDNYSHVDPSVFYTTHNIPGPGIDSELFHSQISRSCKCTKSTETIDKQDAKRKKFESSQIMIDETTQTNVNATNINCTSVSNYLTHDQPNTSAKDKTPITVEDPL